MNKSPKISIIVVSWNVAGSLKRCLDSVFATKYPNLEVIVIDNASSDDSVHVTKNYHDVTVVKNLQNVGFPRAVNQGFKISTGDYFLVLNPDTRLPKDFFTKSLNFTKSHPDMGVIGPRFTDPDGSPQGSIFKEPSMFSIHPKYSLNITSDVNAVSGACMFFPRSTLDKIGPFTEKVFMYFEDLDYCRRIRAAGLKVYYNPEITIIHEHGQSSKQSPNAQKYLWQSNLWYNGPIKHYLMAIISWTGQKFQKLLGNNT